MNTTNVIISACFFGMAWICMIIYAINIIRKKRNQKIIEKQDKQDAYDEYKYLGTNDY